MTRSQTLALLAIAFLTGSSAAESSSVPAESGGPARSSWAPPWISPPNDSAASALSRDGGAVVPIRVSGALDGSWVNVTTHTLGARYFHSTIFDSVRRRVVAFGGHGTGLDVLNDVAFLELAPTVKWTRPSIAGSPPAVRLGHSAIADVIRDRMVVFGGGNGSAYFNDVWTLSLSDPLRWVQVAASGTPPVGRLGQAAVYDRARDRIIVLGGFNGTFLNDVWVLSLSGTPAWTQAFATGVAPTGRDFSVAILDAARDRLLVIGGYDGSWLNDVWELSLGPVPAWSQLFPAGAGPSPRSGAVAVLDVEADRVVMHGGRGPNGDLGDLWELSLVGQGAWNAITTGSPDPGPRSFHAACFDPAQATMLIVAGIRVSTPLEDVGELSTRPAYRWALKVPTSTVPSKRRHFAAGYDELKSRMIVDLGVSWDLVEVCGGVSSVPEYHNDGWTLTLAPSPTWQRLQIPRTILGIEGPAAVWDPIGDRFLVFSGEYVYVSGCLPGHTIPTLSQTYWDQLVSLTLGDSVGVWTVLSPAGPGPSARAGASAIFDPVGNRVLVFGGIATQSGRLNDVWELSLGGGPAWHQLTPIGTPPSARNDHSAIYDPVRSRMIVYGGEALGVVVSDTWELRLAGTPTWARIEVPNAPPSRMLHTAVYDRAADRMIVFGGLPGFNDAWALQFSPSLEWRQLAPSGSGPTSRARHGAVFDYHLQRMMVFGGNDSSGELNDLWALVFDRPTPVLISLVRVNARPEGVELVWHSRDGELVDATVERYTGPGPWQAVAEVVPDGSGLITYVDRLVSPGDRYGYRLLLRGGSTSGALGETWVAVPKKSAFALLGTSPNPTSADVQLSFTLGNEAPAVVELIDLSGRMVLRRDLGPMGPGAYVRSIDCGDRFPAGVYFVRLSQSGQSATRRVSMVR